MSFCFEFAIVDKELVPKLRILDGGKTLDLLLSRAQDEDPNIRDAVATGIASLEIFDRAMKEKAISVTEQMTKQDKAAFAAGRAAAALLRWRGVDSRICRKINALLV